MPSFGSRTRVINPAQNLLTGSRPDQSWFGTNLPSYRQPSDKPLVYGPLGEWMVDKGRPFGSIGRVGINLTTASDVEAGGTNPYQVPRPEGPADAGFFSNLLGGLFGFAGEIPANIGHFIGGGADALIGGLAEVAHLPIGLVTGGIYAATQGGPEFWNAYNAKIQENPLNALLALDDVARQQWEKDVTDGRITGLLQGMGPSSNLWEDMGNVIQVLNVPAAVARRGLEGTFGVASPQLQMVEEYAKGQRSDLQSTFWRELGDRYKSGVFGQVGSKEARDAMMDEVAVYGMIARQADAPDEGLLSGQTLVDMLAMLVTDPLIVGDLAASVASKVALSAARTVSATVLSTIPEAERLGATLDVANYLAKAHNVTPELAMRRMVSRQGTTWWTEGWTHWANLPQNAAIKSAAMEKVNYYTQFKASWEPALRPVANVVRRINSPTEWLPGRGPGSKAINDMFSAQVTEGSVRAFGMDNYMGVLDDLPPDVKTVFQEGFGVQTAFTARAWGRRKLVERMRLNGGLPDAARTPTEIVDKANAGLLGADMSRWIEQETIRVRKYYFAQGRGTQEQVLATAREGAAQRLTLMGMNAADAAAVTATYGPEKLAAIDFAYFGHLQKEWVDTVDQVVASSTRGQHGLDLTQLTPLGPRTMSLEEGERILADIANNDVGSVRQAISDYELLSDHIHSGLKADETLRQVKAVIEDQIEKKGLPRELDPAINLPPELETLRSQYGDLGYRLAYKPEEPWRAILDADGRVIGANPWIELSPKGTAPVEFGRLRQLQERIFHDIRGERILSDARENFIRFATEDGDLTEAEAQSLFARVLAEAKQQNIPPRGLDGEAIFKLIRTHGLPPALEAKIGPRKATEMLLRGFEGNFWHVGWSQKFTGTAKTSLGSTTNWLGVMAEKIYPTVRFFYNPIFQAQELVEGPILNIMRGIKPGWNASDLDKTTITLIDEVLHQSRYAFDDRIEQSGAFLWGLNAVNEAFKPKSRLGEIVRKASFDGKLNVAQIKRINFARQARQEIGKHFQEAMTRVKPDLIPELVGHYGTTDMGELAVRYLTEKANWANHSREYVDAILDASKAAHLGARMPVVLKRLTDLFDDYDSAEGLRVAVAEGGLSRAKFKRVLREQGADPDYITRAWQVVKHPGSAAFWDDWRKVAPGTLKDWDAARNLVRGLADMLGIEEEEFLARYIDGVGGIEAADLMRLSDADRASFARMQQARDALTGRYAMNKAMDDFTTKYGLSADREWHVIADPVTGEILQRDTATAPWRVLERGALDLKGGAGLSVMVHDTELLRGAIGIHNHPVNWIFSSDDLYSALVTGEATSVVISPDVRFVIEHPPEGYLVKDGPLDMFVGSDGLPVRDITQLTTEQKDLVNQLLFGLYNKAMDDGFEYINQRRELWRFLGYGDRPPTQGQQFGFVAMRGAQERMSAMAMDSLGETLGFNWRMERATAFPLDEEAIAEGMANPGRDFYLDAFDRSLTGTFDEAAMLNPPIRTALDSGLPEQDALLVLSSGRSFQPEWLDDLPMETRRDVMGNVDRWQGTRLGNSTRTYVSSGVHLNGGGLRGPGTSIYEVAGDVNSVENLANAYGAMYDADHVTIMTPSAIAHDKAAPGHTPVLHFGFEVEINTQMEMERLENAVRKEIQWLTDQEGTWDVLSSKSSDGQQAIVTLIPHDWEGRSLDDFIDAYGFREKMDELSHQLDNMFADIPEWADHGFLVEGSSVRARRISGSKQDYLQNLRGRGAPEVAADIEGPLAGQAAADWTFAGLAADADATIGALNARGIPLPTAGRVAPYSVERAGHVWIPKGDAPFSPRELYYLDMEAINPRSLMKAETPILPALYERMWKGKRAVGSWISAPEEAWNATAHALLTSRFDPVRADSLFSLLRATRSRKNLGLYGRSLEDLTVDGNYYWGHLAATDFPAADLQVTAGVYWAVNEGLMVRPERASWMRRTARLKMTGEADRAVAQVEDLGGDVSKAVARVNRELALRDAEFRLYRMPTTLEPDLVAPLLIEPEARGLIDDEALAAVGDLMHWANGAVFDPLDRNVTKEVLGWLRDPALDDVERVMLGASVLPGMSGRAAMHMLAEENLRQLAMPVLDEALTRDVVERLYASGEWATFQTRLSKRFVGEVETAMRGEGPWPTPAVRGVRLGRAADVAEGATPDYEAIREVIRENFATDDPVRRLLLGKNKTGRSLIRAVLEQNDGVLYTMGGDYEVLATAYKDLFEGVDRAALGDWGDTLSTGQVGWVRSDIVRGRMRIDPTMNFWTSELPATPPIQNLTAHTLVADGRLAPAASTIRLQQGDGVIRAATIMQENMRALLAVTEHADPTSLYHEMLHIWADTLMDPSLRRDIVNAWREAAGLRPSRAANPRWTNETDEWFVEQMMAFTEVKGKKASTNPRLQGAFEHFQKTIKRVKELSAEEEASGLLKAEKATKLSDLKASYEVASKDVVPLRRAMRTAERSVVRKENELRAAKQRTGIMTLEDRATVAQNVEERLTGEHSLARSNRRIAERNLREAQKKAKQAEGTKAAGGRNRTVARREHDVADAHAEEVRLARELRKATETRKKANIALRGARHRKAISTHVLELEERRAVLKDATKALNEAEAKAKGIATEREVVRRTPVQKPNVKVPKPAVNEKMDDLFTRILKYKPQKMANRSPVDLGQHFNYDEESAYWASIMAVSKGEDQAFTTHYYRRGRSWLERSINHPYFGMYPASYMWGKMLPEMLRFLLKSPFGVDAPLGGLALANQVYRNVLIKQNFDPQFRQDMAENNRLWQTLSMLAPALPWEIPVNAPLWARRTAEAEATRQAKLAAGATPEEAPLFTPQQFGSAVQDMMTYAYGPAYFAQVLGEAGGFLQNVGDTAMGQIEQQLSSVFAPEQNITSLQGPALR